MRAVLPESCINVFHNMTSTMKNLLWEVCLILSITCDGNAQHVILEESDPHVRFSNAFRACNNYNGTLVSVTQFNQYVDDIRQQCNSTTGDYWIGDYSTLTPYLTLMGCYRYNTTGAVYQNFTISNNNVAKCQARCPYERGIAVKNGQCQCVPSLNIIGELTALPVSDCDIVDNGDILGGHQDAMSIYVKDEALNFHGDSMNPFCYFGDCSSRRGAYIARCAAKESAKVVCLNEKNNVSTLNNVSDWWTAMESCINGDYGYLVYFTYFLNHRQEICGNDFTGKVWTTSRQYRSNIIVPDVGITNLQDPNIVCRTANVQSGLSSETGDCNSARRLNGFICKTYKAMSISPLMSADTGVRCILDTTNVRPTTTVLNTLDKSTYLGPVLGSVFAVIVILLSIIGVFIVRRMSEKGTQNRSEQYESYPSQYHNRQDDNDRYEALENPSGATYETPGNPSASTYEIPGNPSEVNYQTLGNPAAAIYETLGNRSKSTYDALENPSAAYETLGNPSASSYETLSKK